MKIVSGLDYINSLRCLNYVNFTSVLHSNTSKLFYMQGMGTNNIEY